LLEQGFVCDALRVWGPSGEAGEIDCSKKETIREPITFRCAGVLRRDWRSCLQEDFSGVAGDGESWHAECSGDRGGEGRLGRGAAGEVWFGEGRADDRGETFRSRSGFRAGAEPDSAFGVS